MALREIIKKGDPVLEKHCHPVTRFDQKLWDLLDDMRETLAQATFSWPPANSPCSPPLFIQSVSIKLR